MSTSNPPVVEPGFLTNAIADPSFLHERLMEIGDVAWDEESGTWLVSSYELIKSVCLDDEGDWKSPMVWDARFPPLGLTFEEWITLQFGSPKALPSAEGADHARMHRWWLRIFSPKLLAKWGDTLIEPFANEQADELLSRGRAELCSEYCTPVTTRVMAAMLGLPSHDADWFDRLRDLREESVGLLEYLLQPWLTPPRELVDGALSAATELYSLVEPVVLEKQDSESDDFISHVWRDAKNLFGTDFTVADIVATTLTAWNGGVRTVSSVAGSSLYVVMTNPGLQREVVAGGDQAVANLVEETARLYGPADMKTRRATKDLELGGVAIKEGDLVFLLSGAGNRDPRQYSRPNEVDVARRSPRDHFGFFRGPRVCAGQGLARFMLAKILMVALQRMQNLQFCPEAVPPRYALLTSRAWRPIHARFERSGPRLSFERDIRPLFRERDREVMEFAFDLWAYEDVKECASTILRRLEDGTMPCDRPWDNERLSLLREWISSGAPR